MAPVVCGFSPWISAFVMLEDTKQGPKFIFLGFFALKFHQLCLIIGIIGRWPKLHDTIVLQDNNFKIYHIL